MPLNLYIGFDGFWPNFDSTQNIFLGILRYAFPHLPIKVVQHGRVDILFISSFKCRHDFHPLVTICFTGENFDFRVLPAADLFLGYKPIGLTTDNFIPFELPFFLIYGGDQHEAYPRSYLQNLFLPRSHPNWSLRKDECVVLISNPTDHRIPQLSFLERFYPLALFGKAFGKPIPGGRSSKLHLLEKYKYHFCDENSLAEGYVTEKLFDAIAAGCIPLYNPSNLSDSSFFSVNHSSFISIPILNQSSPNPFTANIEYTLSTPFLRSFPSKANLFNFVATKILEIYLSRLSVHPISVFTCHYRPNTQRISIIKDQKFSLFPFNHSTILNSDASSNPFFLRHLERAKKLLPSYQSHCNIVRSSLYLHATAASSNKGRITPSLTSQIFPGKLPPYAVGELSSSELSLNLKHRSALARLLNSSSTYAIVLEDDAVPLDSSLSILTSLLHFISSVSINSEVYIDLGGGCDLTYAYHESVTSVPIFSNHRLYDIEHKSSRTTCAYLVNSRFAENFLSRFPVAFAPIDFEYLFYLDELHLRSPSSVFNHWLDPPAFIHGSQKLNIASSIQKKV